MVIIIVAVFAIAIWSGKLNFGPCVCQACILPRNHTPSLDSDYLYHQENSVALSTGCQVCPTELVISVTLYERGVCMELTLCAERKTNTLCLVIIKALSNLKRYIVAL